MSTENNSAGPCGISTDLVEDKARLSMYIDGRINCWVDFNYSELIGLISILEMRARQLERLESPGIKDN